MLFLLFLLPFWEEGSSSFCRLFCFFFPRSPLLPFLNGFLSGGVEKQGGGRRGGLSACKSLLLLLLLHFGSFGSFGSGCFLYLLLSCVSSSMVDGNGGYSSSLEPFVGGVTTILVLLYLQNPSLPPSLPWAFYSLGTSSCSCCQLCSSGLFVFSSSKCRSFAKGLLALESREHQPDVQQLQLLSVFCCPFLHARFAHVQGCGMKVPYIESFAFSQ